jgi:hypothetical protein
MQTRRLIKLAILIIFWFLLLVAAILAIYEQNWFNLALSILTLALTFLPSYLEKRFRVDYPEEFEIIILIFIFACLFLGEIGSFYFVFWWWDLFLHGLSAIILGIIAFSLIYILNKEGRIKLKPSFIALFAFCFALSFGVIWEIFEFFVDQILGTNMQRASLFDTMSDLIIDALGALFISFIGFLYSKGRLEFLRFFGESFKAYNPQIFGEYDPLAEIR